MPSEIPIQGVTSIQTSWVPGSRRVLPCSVLTHLKKVEETVRTAGTLWAAPRACILMRMSKSNPVPYDPYDHTRTEVFTEIHSWFNI